MSAYHAWQRVTRAAREFVRAADLPDTYDTVYPKVHAIEEFRVAITSWVRAHDQEREQALQRAMEPREPPDPASEAFFKQLCAEAERAEDESGAAVIRLLVKRSMS